MPDTFEPFQRVIGRGNHYWRADLFSHYGDNGICVCIADSYGINECIPYTPETAHLIGTSQPDEPPKPPVQYEWGDKVEVYTDGRWEKAIFNYACEIDGVCVMPKTSVGLRWVKPDRIRPLPDSAAH